MEGYVVSISIDPFNGGSLGEDVTGLVSIYQGNNTGGKRESIKLMADGSYLYEEGSEPNGDSQSRPATGDELAKFLDVLSRPGI